MMTKTITRGGLLLAVTLGVALAGCSSDPEVATYTSALSGKQCRPDPQSLMPMAPMSPASLHKSNGNGGQRSPTGIPGDNLDDLHSGKIDCYYDGNSGQGDDRKHPCTMNDFPQPGCDSMGCCDDDVLLPDPEQTGTTTQPGDPTEPTDPTQPSEPTSTTPVPGIEQQ